MTQKPKIRAGIIGASGYTGGELLRILLNHPAVELDFAYSRQFSRQPVYRIHPDLSGQTNLQFTDQVNLDVEVVFLSLGHGVSAAFLQEHPFPEKTRIIDLSRDFRLQSANTPGFVYGLPEWQREVIRAARRVANPGCFATAIQLALLPLAVNGWLPDEIHIQAITGSTGAGKELRPTTHYSWRHNNLSVYRVFNHHHLPEIKQTLRKLQPGFTGALRFVPYRGNFTRGIFATLYLQSDLSISQAQKLYREYYRNHPFVEIAPENPDLKWVVNTNRAVLYLQKYGEILFIVSLIDNLLKGASGQAVQNMNLMFGLPETSGLNLKPVVY